MRSFMLIAFFSVVVLASSTSGLVNNTITIGSRPTTACFADELVIKKEVRKHNSGGLGGLFDKTFKTTETFSPGHGARITLIKVTDLKKNGASVHIKNGGIGQTSVTLEFENKKHGFHFDVEIYASKK